MYFLGFVGLGFLIYVAETSNLDDLQVWALFLGSLFVNLAGWLHGHRQAEEREQKRKERL